MKKGTLIAAALAAVAAIAAFAYFLFRSPEHSAAEQAEALLHDAPGPALTPEQKARRVADHRRLWREADYAEIRRRAQEDDVLAQRRLAEIMEDCLSYRGQMSTNLNIVTQMRGMQPATRASVENILRDRQRFCPYADAELKARGAELSNYWLHRSAKGGDLASEIRYFSRTVPQVKIEQFNYLVGEVARSRDPDAIFEVSALLARTVGVWPDPTQKAAFEGTAAEQAWAIAACREGLDCTRGSRVMNLMCLSMFACQYPDYETLVFAQPSYAAQRQDIEKTIALIRQRILIAPPAH